MIDRALLGDALKRSVDFCVAAFALTALLPLMALVAALVWFDSGRPIIFRQERIGKNFRPFQIYKFRTMIVDAARPGPLITQAHDSRITRIGHILRRFKIDELPQLFNVLKGEMSLVGPRPEISKYVELFRGDYAQILSVRPGLTDLASLKFIAEAELLARSSDPEHDYVSSILPQKIELAREYLRLRSFAKDLGLLLRTVDRLLH